MPPKFALLWRRDGSNGVKWNLRGLRPDGSFYGSIHEMPRRKATSVDGALEATDSVRCQEILRQLGTRPATPPGPCFALLARWESSPSDAEIILKYDVGDERTSEDARAFLELTALLEKEISKAYARLA
jgi:hypothetical protein